MSRALFVSDIHITSPADPKHGLFLRFLAKLESQPAGHLFLVGDIFDLWIADRSYFVERYAEAIQALRDLKARGWMIHYFEGNHDLDLKRFWQNELGFDVREQAAYFSLAGKTVRVEHGDQMDPHDRGYLFLRWFLRTRLMRGLGRYLPNAAVRWIGERASRASRDYTSTVKTTSRERSLDVIRAHARTVHGEKPFDIFVSGHVHVTEDSEQTSRSGDFRCFNLGTWLHEPCVLELATGKVGLRPLSDFLAAN